MMTDKEIIIDVNKCKYRDTYSNYCLAEGDDIGECYTICTGNDCYYKQFKRKEQELETSQHYNDELTKYILEIGELFNLTQRTTIIGKNYIEYYAILSSAITNQINDLQAENNRYKQALEKIEEIVKEEIVCDNCNLQGTNKCDSRLCTSFYLNDFCKQLFLIINEVKDGTIQTKI